MPIYRAMSPRRLVWIARACLYGALALVAVFVWASRSPDTRDLTGTTDQGEHFDLTLDGEQPRALGTYLRARCPDGETRDVSWTAEHGVPVEFQRDGDRFTVREEWESTLDQEVTEFGLLALEGRVEDGGDSASGRMSVTMRYYHAGGQYATCRVTGVRWNALLQ